MHMQDAGVRHFILGTAGHIDHGKSSLVKVLTGTDPDRLPEEKARGMTIDLGFAHLELQPDGGQGPVISLGIIDVPGHADFVKNMVAGTGGIDAALLAVAADDSWMPQTEEHMQILWHLGVRQAVVALTKADLTDDWALAEMDVREHLAGTPFADAPVVAVSSVTGAGIEELRRCLREMFGRMTEAKDIGKPRLAVDRVFSVKGIGTVVTGTLTGGSLVKGQEVLVLPAGIPTKVRSLQTHGRETDKVRPGTRVAVGLQGVAIASREQRGGVKRGDVVGRAPTGPPSVTAGVWIERLERGGRAGIAAGRPLRHGVRVRFHYGSDSRSARVFFVDPGRRELGIGERALAQLRFEEPVDVHSGDRFVLRSWGMEATLGGGLVLDPEASRRQYRSEAQRAFLEAVASAPDDLEAQVRARLVRDKAVRRAGLLERSLFSESEIADVMSTMVRKGTLVTAGGWLLDGKWWAQLRGQAIEMVDDHHRHHPQEAGLGLSKLEAALRAQLPCGEIFEHLVKSLAAGEHEVDGDTVRRRGYRAVLAESQGEAAERILARLAAKPLDPPAWRDLLEKAGDDKVLRYLIERGEVVKLDAATAVTAQAYREFVAKVSRYLAACGQATASEIRQETGTTRRVLIPLLEKLDADRITIRRGDARVLRQVNG